MSARGYPGAAGKGEYLGYSRVLRVLVATNPFLVDNQFTRGSVESELCRSWPWLTHLSIEGAVILHGAVEEIRELAACRVA